MARSPRSREVWKNGGATLPLRISNTAINSQGTYRIERRALASRGLSRSHRRGAGATAGQDLDHCGGMSGTDRRARRVAPAMHQRAPEACAHHETVAAGYARTDRARRRLAGQGRELQMA